MHTIEATEANFGDAAVTYTRHMFIPLEIIIACGRC